MFSNFSPFLYFKIYHNFHMKVYKEKLTFCGTSGSTSALMGTLKKRMLFSFSPTVICRTLNMFRNDCSTIGSFPKSLFTRYCFLAEYWKERPFLLWCWDSWNFALLREIGGRQKRHTLGGVRYGSSIWNEINLKIWVLIHGNVDTWDNQNDKLTWNIVLLSIYDYRYIFKKSHNFQLLQQLPSKQLLMFYKQPIFL